MRPRGRQGRTEMTTGRLAGNREAAARTSQRGTGPRQRRRNTGLETEDPGPIRLLCPLALCRGHLVSAAARQGPLDPGAAVRTTDLAPDTEPGDPQPRMREDTEHVCTGGSTNCCACTPCHRGPRTAGKRKGSGTGCGTQVRREQENQDVKTTRGGVGGPPKEQQAQGPDGTAVSTFHQLSTFEKQESSHKIWVSRTWNSEELWRHWRGAGQAPGGLPTELASGQPGPAPSQIPLTPACRY